VNERVANDKGDNELIPGAAHRSPGICLTTEENSGKPQLGDRRLKEYTTSHCLKWDPFPPNKVGRNAQHVRTSDVKKEGKGGEGSNMLYNAIRRI
jgi:hypothetical protein